jgi:four helix bundle protein
MINFQSNLNSQNSKKYDLEERTKDFSKEIIDFCQKLSSQSVISPLVNQLIRSGTSIGANYHEANEGSSKKDFVNKIFISKKETKETQYWLELIAHSVPEHIVQARLLWKEAQELKLIFAAIIRSSRKIEN